MIQLRIHDFFVKQSEQKKKRGEKKIKLTKPVITKVEQNYQVLSIRLQHIYINIGICIILFTFSVYVLITLFSLHKSSGFFNVFMYKLEQFNIFII